MADRYTALASLLAQLQQTLEQQGLWQLQPPSAEALASTEPFCVDTLCFDQWLQWAMVPRFRALIDAGMALPASCNIAPYAEEALPGQPEIVALVLQIDQLCNGV